MCYILDYSEMPPDEAERLIKKIKSVAETCSENGQDKLVRFCMISGSPDIFNIPDYCNLRLVNAGDQF